MHLRYLHDFHAGLLSTKASRQSTLGYTHGSSLSVDGAQATNSMVTQDTDKFFYPERRGRISCTCREESETVPALENLYRRKNWSTKKLF